MKEELIKLMASQTIKNVEVERELDLPKNSLSNILSGKKPMPEKWATKIQNYISTKTPKAPEKPLRDPSRPWIQEIEQYCLMKGIFPDALIEFHKMHCDSEISKALKMLKNSLGNR
jgi:hypothetical protein